MPLDKDFSFLFLQDDANFALAANGVFEAEAATFEAFLR